MKVVLRTDASIQIGTGHVMRCLTLADALVSQGHQCHFVCREHQGHLGELIIRKGHALTLLPLPENSSQKILGNPDDDYASWLCVPWPVDAEQTLQAMAGTRVDWLVVDHYALDARWEQQLADAAEKIMVIDDLTNRAHQCDLLLDQNVLEPCIEKKYKKLVNQSCKLLLGPQYALLRPEYGNLAKILPERDGNVSRILIFVGGSDPYDLTTKFVNVLDQPEFRDLSLDVVLGANHPSPKYVNNLISSRPKTRIYSNLDSLAALMIRADLMLGAGGSTNWERMCLGLNSIIVSVAENQYKVNDILQTKGLLCFLGSVDRLDNEAIVKSLKESIVAPEELRYRSGEMRSLVDGKGANKVIMSMLCY